jgi:hypothetical protein
MSNRRAPYLLILLIATAGTLLAPPWRYELTVTDVRPDNSQLRGFDRSEIAFAWDPPMHQQFLPAGQSGREIRTEGSEVDSSRRAVWWAIIAVSALAVAAPASKMRLSCGVPVRAVVLVLAALLGLLMDQAYVDTVRPHLEARQLERGLKDEFGMPSGRGSMRLCYNVRCS